MELASKIFTKFTKKLVIFKSIFKKKIGGYLVFFFFFFFFFVLFYCPRGLSPIIDFTKLYAKSRPQCLTQELPDASWTARPERSLPPRPNLSPVVYGHALFRR